MIHGTADTDVPAETSKAMAEALAERKLPHELILIPGGEHGLGGGDKKLAADAHQRAIEFLREHSKRRARPVPSISRLFRRPRPR